MLSPCHQVKAQAANISPPATTDKILCTYLFHVGLEYQVEQQDEAPQDQLEAPEGKE